MMTRIGIVCTSLTHGGAEHCAVMWANGFHQRGHEVMVITNLYEPVSFQLDEGIELRNLVATNSNKLKKWGSSFGLTRKALKAFQPDVVIGVMSTCSFVAKVASVGMRIPVIATEHNSFERPASAPFSLCDRICKFGLNYLYDGVTVLTEADVKIASRCFKNITVMPNPLALCPTEDSPIRNHTILAVGRLDAWHYKGFDVLIKAWGSIKNSSKFKVQSSKSEKWRLQIAGTGSNESLRFLQQLCKENGIEDSVDFLGFRSDMEHLYQQSSVFVLSSRYEGFGLVLIEAMSQGCACIACDYKGRQREIMCPEGQVQSSKFKVQSPSRVSTYKSGICCEPNNIEALAEALQKMICDDEYRESVRRPAIEHTKYYSIDNTIDRWEDYLNHVLKK